MSSALKIDEVQLQLLNGDYLGSILTKTKFEREYLSIKTSVRRKQFEKTSSEGQAIERVYNLPIARSFIHFLQTKQ
jgi:hypothetical protein